MPKLQLPHWAMLVVSALSAVLAWLNAENSAHEIVLPTVVLGLLPMVQMVLGMLSPSISENVNAKAAAKVAKALVVLACVGAMGTVGVSACATAAPVVAPVTSCVAAVIADALAGLDVQDIMKKEGQACVGDAAEVVMILLGSDDPAVAQTKAYASAKAIHAAQVSK